MEADTEVEKLQICQNYLYFMTLPYMAWRRLGRDQVYPADIAMIGVMSMGVSPQTPGPHCARGF